MILRWDVQRVLQALLETEWSYWVDHKQEWMRLCHDPADLWDGYHWHFVRCLVQAQLWADLKNHIKGLCETHLKDQILLLIERASPRLYRELELPSWVNEKRGVEKKEEAH